MYAYLSRFLLSICTRRVVESVVVFGQQTPRSSVLKGRENIAIPVWSRFIASKPCLIVQIKLRDIFLTIWRYIFCPIMFSLTLFFIVSKQPAARTFLNQPPFQCMLHKKRIKFKHFCCFIYQCQNWQQCEGKRNLFLGKK